MDIIDTLRSALLARRADWGAIAEQAGCDRKTIYRIATGRSEPSLRVALGLVRGAGLRFGVTVAKEKK